MLFSARHTCEDAVVSRFGRYFDCDVEGNARAMPALAPATIAGLARSAGVDVETIRSYERMGLLPKPRRRPGRSGDAAYHQEHFERLSFIRRAVDLPIEVVVLGHFH